MVARIKAFFAWVYEWITVLTASLVGVPSMVFEFLSVFDGIDLTSVLPPERAIKIITFMAILKALCAYIVRKREA